LTFVSLFTASFQPGHACLSLVHVVFCAFVNCFNLCFLALTIRLLDMQTYWSFVNHLHLTNAASKMVPRQGISLLHLQAAILIQTFSVSTFQVFHMFWKSSVSFCAWLHLNYLNVNIIFSFQVSALITYY